MTFVQFLIINLGALVAASGGIFLKRLSSELVHGLPLYELALNILRSPNLWLGGFCYIFPIFLWTYLLKYMELTKLQPLLAIVYLYTILLSVIFLGESPSVGRMFGISLILAGVIFVGRS
ncbi:MAG: EamA family transporter [Paracoccaceae bacterium]